MRTTLFMILLSVNATVPCIAYATTQSCCTAAMDGQGGSVLQGSADQIGSGGLHVSKGTTTGPGKRLAQQTVSGEIAPAAETAKNASREGLVRTADASVTNATQDLSEPVSDDSLGEVIVTAQRRSQKAFNVPISLVVLGAPELEERQIINLSDLQFAVPGLYVQSNDAQRRITLNGVTNPLGNGAFVSEYMDEADITSQGFAGAGGYGEFDTQTYDLERVEVLRGPQGTLYGVGAMGGTIRFITNKPVLDRFEVEDGVSALFTQYGAPSQRMEAMLNTPLVTNILGIRLAGEVEHDGGWIDEPVARQKNINSQNLVDARVEGLWKPGANFQVNVTQLIHRNNYGLNTGEDSNGNFTPVFDLTVAPRGEENFNLSNVTMTYSFSHAQLLSSTTYFHHYLLTQDYMSVIPFTSGAVFEADYPFYPVDAKDVSQELRLARTGAGPWQWTVGGFYKHYKDSEDFGYYFGLPGPLSSTPFYSFLEGVLSKSRSVFADTSYELMRRLTIGAGVRYFKDDEAFSQTGLAAQEASFTSTDPRFYVQYRITRNVNTYASAAKGFRSGGFNSFGQPQYDPEQVWTYELGTKMRSSDNLINANADVFVTNYSRYVVQGFSPANPALFIFNNAGDARIKGLEVDLEWRPSDRWRFSINGDYLDAKFVALTALGTGYTVGERLPFVSKYTIAPSVVRDYRWGGKPGYIRLDYSQVSPQQSQYSGGPLEMSDVIHMLNLRTGIQWNDNLRLGFFAQNLLNDRGYLDANPIGHIAPRPRPRTFGIDIGASFD
jgi:iron complex outermembrane receptor protein